MSKGRANGITRGDLRRNARKARLRVIAGTAVTEQG
ncbi:MAG: hypothetical protein QOJ73_3108 [Streptosporangiaceae bacterium]|jgi:hypothetical protein|nr:hypothetical protein [Streptosporangiaceae bacterium]